MFDGKAFGQEVVAAVKVHVDKSLAPILNRLAAVEKAMTAMASDDMDAVKSDVESLRKAIAELPVPEAPALPDIEAMVARAVAAIPAPSPGKDADPALVKQLVDEAVSGLPAPEAKEVDMEEVRAKLASEVERVLAGWDRPQDGKSVTAEELAPMVAECVKKAVESIPAPKDGCGIKELLIDRDGNLVATMDDGRMKELGRVVGRDGNDADMLALERRAGELIANLPKPKDGKDGFDLRHFDANLGADGRTLILSFTDDERNFVIELGIPSMVYRGVWKDGPYQKGDTCTFGGHLWHCDVDGSTEKPDSPAKHWTMAVRRGRDGKDKA